MTNPDLQAGDVLTYPYLWRRQHEGGETEGRKDRPACVLVAVRRSTDTHLALLAISSQPPLRDQRAIEIPEIECRRGGLNASRRAWLFVDEFNYDVAERSFYLDPRRPPLGRFSRSFMKRVAAATAALFRDGTGRVDRER